MATVALTTTPTQIDAGTAYTVLVTNAGAVTVDLSRGGRLRPGQTATVYPEGTALTAAATSGTGSVTTATTTKPLPNPSDPAALAARPEFTGTYAAQSLIDVRLKGAKLDGATDDSVAWQAALDAAETLGLGVLHPGGVSIAAGVEIGTGVHIWGVGAGGDVYSNTDSQLPFKGSVLKLKSGANTDLLKTKNFATLTGQASPNPYTTPTRFGLHDLLLDGNKTQNTSGLPLRIFGRSYIIDGVRIQNGAVGGAYSEWGSGGYDMEARWTNFQITDCAGDGLVWKGPHDSQFSNGVVARNDSNRGIYIVPGSYVGGELFTNVHAWGAHTYQWVIGTTNGGFVNCVSDGPGGVQIVASGNTWLGGAIYGSNVPGENAITLGDGTTRTIAANTFRTRVFNYSKGSLLHRLTANTTPSQNTYQLQANCGGASRYTGGSGKTTLTGATTFPTATVAVTDASAFPASGNAYISDGTTIINCAYTGVTGNTLTGVTGGTGTVNSGGAVFSLSVLAANDTWEVTDPDNTSAGGFWQTTQSTILTRTWLANSSFNVGTQTVRPNSSGTAIQWLRNETGRIDMTWDNTGSSGNIYVRNSALLRGQKDTTTDTWQIASSTGGIRPGTASGVGGTLYSGSGAPTISASAGDAYLRTDGGAGTWLYRCTGGTAWTAVV